MDTSGAWDILNVVLLFIKNEKVFFVYVGRGDVGVPIFIGGSNC